MYQYLDAALVRAPAWDIRDLALPWPDMAGGAAAASWRSWLDQAWQIPGFAAAVETASPDLARQVTRIRTAADLPDAAVRRTVLSVLRYLLRGTSRATPFGLLAGVAPARIGRGARIHAGNTHRAAARADATWLTGVIEMMEADDQLRPRLIVAASDLIVARGGYLVIGHRPGTSAETAPEQVKVRAARPVLAALDAARSPIRAADLAAKLAAEFPDADGSAISHLIAQMIAQRLLLTNLRAPTTEPDPLAALLAKLATVLPHSDPRVTSLRAASTSLARHNSARDPAVVLAQRHRAAALMTGLIPTGRPVLAIDLRLDWDLTIPHVVATEAAKAAGALTRLASNRALNRGWAVWHARFLDRYGPGAVVPVLDATDDAAGLGFPAGYLGSPYPGQEDPPFTERDKILLRLAQQAILRREHEINLEGALIDELAVPGAGDPAQPSAELTVRMHAARIADVDAGRFTLHVTGVSRGTGTVAGRFLHLVDGPDRARMLAVYGALPGAHRGSLPAHLSATPLYPRAENIARVPQAARLLISVGEHPAADPARQIPVSDLAVTADARTLHLVSLSRREPVHTILPSAIDVTIHTHPLARFLLEAPVALATPCAAFDWGAASALPVLPALRYGRTVLSPARWRLNADSLPGKHDTWSRWDEALADWATRAWLPRHIQAGDGDRRIALDLAEPSHRVLLRDEIDRTGHARLHTAPSPGDLGWADGHPHEITIPLAAAGPPAHPVRHSSSEVTTRRHGDLPGCGRRLYLQLYAPRDLQDTILTRHLPRLATELGDKVRWWFIRYGNPGPHLRLRLLLPASYSPGEAAEQAGAWVSELRAHGLINRVTWDTYYPETARFGGAGVMDEAEAFFAADSAAAAAQIATSASKNGPGASPLTAASMADIVTSATADHHNAMHWLARHVTADSVPPPRPVYNAAVALVGSPRAGLADSITQAWLARRAALAAYRSALAQAGSISLTDLLPDLLHLHHARIAGPDPAAERACLHLARAGALSWLARTRKEAW
jgi:thiopeptide-type bacteriocin biosynthesis protein